MNIEDAQKKADEMIAALGEGWVASVKENHGWYCTVSNGACGVTFSENSQRYDARINAGIAFNASSAFPRIALASAAQKMNAHFARISGERDAILAIVSATAEVEFD